MGFGLLEVWTFTAFYAMETLDAQPHVVVVGEQSILR